LRDGVGDGGQGTQGRGWPSGPSSAGVTMPVVADVYSHLADGEHPEPEEDMEIEDGDDIGEDARGLFGIDLGDGTHPIDLDVGDGDGGVAASTDTHGTSSTGGTGKGKLISPVWEDFTEIKEGKIRVAAICKMCGKRYSARSAAGTGHLKRHQKSCKAKHDNDKRVQSRLALNADGLHNWVYDPAVARTELCRLIARLNLPLGIGETQAWEDYIKRAHNPRFEKVFRQATTRDMGKLFAEQRSMLMNSLFPACSSVSLTFDIWSGNAKEDYISVVAYYVSADWELQKKIVGFRLIEVSHSGENIAKK